MQVCIIYENAYLRKLKNIQMKKYSDSLEFVAKRINANMKLKREFVFVAGSLLYVSNIASAATKDPMAKVDIAGNTILNIVRRIGYWCCIMMCIVDVIKSLLQGDTKSIAKIMMKYAFAFAALYMFPWILDLIKSIF